MIMLFSSVSDSTPVRFVHWKPGSAQPHVARSDGKPLASRRACNRCRQHKIRCEFADGEPPCQRCGKANANCETVPRQKRPRAPNKGHAARFALDVDTADHRVGDTSDSLDASDVEEEDETLNEGLELHLTESSRDGVKAPFQIIRDGVPSKHKHAANVTTPPVGAPKNLPSLTASGKIEGGKNAPRPDFNPHPAKVLGVEKVNMLEVLTPTEIDMLFHLFMSKVNPYLGMFDEKLHTLQYIRERGLFLLNVIVMIASRYYTNRPDTYVQLVHIAKRLAGEAITNMTESIMHVQAFILLAVYPAPDHEYLSNTPWLYSGVAFRMATELGLYKQQPLPAATETIEREALNRTRTWIICFCLDVSISVHFGRPITIARDDAVVKNATKWWQANRDRYDYPYDAHLIVNVGLLCTFCTALEKVEKTENEDYDGICRELDREIAELIESSNTLFEQYTTRTNPVCILREHLCAFTAQYSRLIIYSIAFQKGCHPTPEFEQERLIKLLQSAFRVLDILVKDIVPTGLLQYAWDGYFWGASFASAILLKFLSAEHRDKVDNQTRELIVIRVRELVEALGRRAVAVDSSLPPRLFSHFLNSMLSKHIRGATMTALLAGESSAVTLNHTDSVTGHCAGDEASNTGAFPPPPLLSGLESIQTISLTAGTGPRSAFGDAAHVSVAPAPLPLLAQPTNQLAHVVVQPFGTQVHGIYSFNTEVEHGPWSIPYGTLADQEMFTGMFTPDHPPWWTDHLNLGLESITGVTDDRSSIYIGAREQGEFSAFDAPQYGGA